MGGSIIEETDLLSARLQSGYSIQTAAKSLGVTDDELEAYEANSESVPVSVAVRMARLYRRSIDSICFRSSDR
ncbi:helix-turn-helix transcriptional regulator [Cohnella sp. GbtcB17]|uniref:helix-turn-helix domain-containing protein n=1 Tax=Cohnella sp. GbtcB17 TaxID=2824762 RepID=UPI001C2FDB29